MAALRNSSGVRPNRPMIELTVRRMEKTGQVTTGRRSCDGMKSTNNRYTRQTHGNP